MMYGAVGPAMVRYMYNVYMYVNIYKYTHVYMCVQQNDFRRCWPCHGAVCIYVYVCMYVHICTCIYMCIAKSCTALLALPWCGTFIYMYLYIYIYIHVYMCV